MEWNKRRAWTRVTVCNMFDAMNNRKAIRTVRHDFDAVRARDAHQIRTFFVFTSILCRFPVPLCRTVFPVASFMDAFVRTHDSGNVKIIA